MYTPDELKLLVGETGTSTLITFDTVLPNIKALTQLVPVKRVIVTTMTDYINGMPRASAESLKFDSGWLHFSTLLDSCTETKLPNAKVSPDDPAVIQFTGGTTGIPKGAMLTHSNLLSSTVQAYHWGVISREYTPPAERVILGIIPFFHVFGNVVAMNYAMWSCATLIAIPRFEIEDFLKTLSRFERITFWPATPTMVAAVLNHPKAVELGQDVKWL